MIVVFLGLVHLLFMSKTQSQDGQYLRVVKANVDRGEGRQSDRAAEKKVSQQAPAIRQPSQVSHRVMALTYHEQLYTALKFEMFSLATVAADFNAPVVEPLLVSSRMYGLRDLVPVVDRQYLNSTVPLGDMVEFSSLLHHCTGVDMIPFSTFMDAVPRKVVLVYVQTYGLHQPREITLDSNFQSDIHAQLASHDEMVMDCTRAFEDKQSTLLKHIERALTKNASIPSKPPQVVQVLCLSHMSVVHTSDLWLHFPKALTTSQENHLIMFLNWRGCFILDCSRESYERWKRREMSWANQNRYKILTTHSIVSRKCGDEAIPQSKTVKRAAETYLSDEAMIRKPFLGVHIRTERLAKGAVEGGSVGKDFLDCVLNKLADRVAAVRKNQTFKHILVCTDFDKDHGSDSCGSKFCRDTGEYIHSTIEDKFGWKVTKFNPLSLELADNSGFVALVEMNMLLLSDHLILVGHGNFQDQLLAHYLSSGNEASSYSRISVTSKCSP